VVEDAVHPGTSNATLWLDTIDTQPCPLLLRNSARQLGHVSCRWQGHVPRPRTAVESLVRTPHSISDGGAACVSGRRRDLSVDNHGVYQVNQRRNGVLQESRNRPVRGWDGWSRSYSTSRATFSCSSAGGEIHRLHPYPKRFGAPRERVIGSVTTEHTGKLLPRLSVSWIAQKISLRPCHR
jgi:hypothetical protein